MITKDKAVIGWVVQGGVGNNPISFRFNYDHVPVCTIDIPDSLKERCIKVTERIGLWGI